VAVCIAHLPGPIVSHSIWCWNDHDRMRPNRKVPRGRAHGTGPCWRAATTSDGAVCFAPHVQMTTVRKDDCRDVAVPATHLDTPDSHCCATPARSGAHPRSG